ncbi:MULTISPECIES: ABC transporter substrate-binding protein [Paenibacillus]|uniref:ABC transporter substrate-binding protein n=1 Tax=Paenibacillus vini TaxID=1476024 RepID=A0ABQ4M9Q1_9BACL|nr:MULTISPECIES: ABC transporter substrate-binding protein [Paenibacillus]MBQ4899703.1 ABC transporter substrate-binding protein [Paenibacillus sp. Marseille-P2973]MDN4069659.1 ABC transporter substrate-binding protein [Paenibacillus vini]GIP52721.1 ABC transporter substrate-binding protein [Paenibacillus vini]
MNKKRKSFSLLLISLVALSLIVSACGGNKADNSAAKGNSGKSEKPVELIWYTIGAPQKDLKRVVDEVNKYTLEKINATIDMKMIDFGDYTQKMQVMAASGEPMDIMFTSSWAFDYVQNARKGAFMELDDLLSKYGKGITDTLDPAFLEGSKVDGHNYAIPANKELPAQEVWRFNKELLDKYNLDISKATTMESLEPMLKTIKENEPGITPYAMLKDFMPVMPFDYVIEKMPMAVYMDTKDYKVVNILETPEAKSTLETVRKFYQAGYVSPEVATTTSVDDLYKSGKWFMDRAATQPLADNLWSASYGYPVVSTPASQPYIYNWSVMGSMQAISANSEHPEKAMEFLNLLNTDSYLRNLIDSGIEGVHYEKVNDNTVKNLADAKNYDMPTFSLGNVMITYLNEGDPENKWDEFKKFNASGINAPLLGFNFDTSAVTNEIAAVQNVKEEFWSSLMTGTVDPNEYLAKANEKFKAAGLDKIIAEAQKQIDEWRAANNK